jgi:hypothetical protein
MMTLDEFRKTDPELEKLTDDELAKVMYLLYMAGELALEGFVEDKSSKIPLGIRDGLNSQNMKN